MLGPFVAFFGTGYFSGLGAVVAELYPTAVRATAAGFCYNFGRIASAAAPYTIGSVAATRGFGVAFTITGAAFLLAALTWIWIPETRNRELTYAENRRPLSAAISRSYRPGLCSYQSSCSDHPSQRRHLVQRHWCAHPGQRPRVTNVFHDVPQPSNETSGVPSA